LRKGDAITGAVRQPRDGERRGKVNALLRPDPINGAEPEHARDRLQVATHITTNNPECHLMVVLVDERPEEVTDMQRSVKGEVIASTFDRPAEDHTTVAELAIERAKR